MAFNPEVESRFRSTTSLLTSRSPRPVYASTAGEFDELLQLWYADRPDYDDDAVIVLTAREAKELQTFIHHWLGSASPLD